LDEEGYFSAGGHRTRALRRGSRVGAVVFVLAFSSSQAQIVVNGTAARSLWIGETSPEGVKLSDIRNGRATFEAGGRRFALGSVNRALRKPYCARALAAIFLPTPCSTA